MQTFFEERQTRRYALAYLLDWDISIYWDFYNKSTWTQIDSACILYCLAREYATLPPEQLIALCLRLMRESESTGARMQNALFIPPDKAELETATRMAETMNIKLPNPAAVSQENIENICARMHEFLKNENLILISDFLNNPSCTASITEIRIARAIYLVDTFLVLDRPREIPLAKFSHMCVSAPELENYRRFLYHNLFAESINFREELTSHGTELLPMARRMLDTVGDAEALCNRKWTPESLTRLASFIENDFQTNFTTRR